MGRNSHLLGPCLRFVQSRRLPRRTKVSPACQRCYVKPAEQIQRHKGPLSLSTDAQQRWTELRGLKSSPYPRPPASDRTTSCRDFLRLYEHLAPNTTADSKDVILCGRIHGFRIAGPKLVFLDIVQDNHKVQGVCNFSGLGQKVSMEDFRSFYHMLTRGDAFSIRGKPHRTSRQSLSLLISELPTLLSPCLHQIPSDLQNPETKIRNRHVDLLVNRQAAEVLRFKSDMINYIRNFLLKAQYMEIHTPILESGAGGAVARPFQTTSIGFADQQLNLRIAPELWLKRLIIGGFDSVFEIGSCFRNEGLDVNHNPEFTTCEFYRAYADLESLIETTETLLSGLSAHSRERIAKKYQSLDPKVIDYKTPFRRLDFISGIESAINRKLPDLNTSAAEPGLMQIFQDCGTPLPDSPTLPRMLDKLSSTYLEPQCSAPTFIINYPECMSPLSKSFVHPDTQQRVAARAELFVDGQEIVNTYEEENSPIEQRRKFVEQLRLQSNGEEESLDTINENYLQALEWGLPPTGGWGCGIDRLCMLMSGAPRIGDVLSFGSLRNVIGLGRGLPTSS